MGSEWRSFLFSPFIFSFYLICHIYFTLSIFVSYPLIYAGGLVAVHDLKDEVILRIYLAEQDIIMICGV